MLNAVDAKEINKSTIESLIGPASQETTRSHKRSFSSFFRSLSGTSRAGRNPDLDALEDGLIPVRRRSTIRKPRHPRHTPSSLSQSAIDVANSQFDQSRMLRLARHPQSPPSHYQTIPEDDTPLPPSSHEPRASTPRPSLSPSAMGAHSVPGAIEDLPPPHDPLSVSPHQDTYSELSSPFQPLVYVNHTRRKASMSKLMRHFGETRIPPELVLPPDQSGDQDVVEQETLPLRRQRTKSLDLRPLASDLQIPASYGTPPGARPHLSRTRSLGQRTTSLRSRRNADERPLAEAAQDRVRRARKIAQIFGPELPYELIVNAEQIQNRKSMDTPINHLPPNEQASPPSLPGIPSLLPSLERASHESNTTTTASDPSDEWNTLVESCSAPVRLEEAEHRRRTQKLAKFFGVSQRDISCSVSSEPIVKTPLVPPRAVIAGAPTLPLHEVEVNVKLAGRRFWGFSSPNQPEYRHADTNDAIVIDQLRTLKAS